MATKGTIKLKPGDRFLRAREVYKRVGLQRTSFHNNYIATGKYRWKYITVRAKGLFESEVDEILNELAQRAA
jgi:predicted DNA-binding transcriptional regulator AlpA